ncbi:MAG TPA: hypothetical protein VEU47_11720 [Candidatus Cybelea sp.]|nr:hypothetical protein [Candidatus Cybelea sp.]
MVVTVAVPRGAGRLHILLQLGEGFLRTGHVAGLQRLADGGEVRLELAVAAVLAGGLARALHALGILQALLQRRERLLRARQIARGQALLELVEIIPLLLELGLLRALKDARIGRNRADGHGNPLWVQIEMNRPRRVIASEVRYSCVRNAPAP